MLRLNTTTRQLQVLLSGAITTNQLPVMVCYSDKTATGYNGGTQLANTNNATAVDICAAPAASTVRDIDSINIYNRDTVAATVSVIYNDNATTYVLLKATLAVGDQLIYTHGQGWKVVDSTGSVKSGGGISGPIAASSVTNTPAGNIAATTVQAAINELDAEKQDSTRGADITAASTITIPSAGSYFVVTGNTTISAIADSWNGRTAVLKFSGTPQLINGAGLVLPGGVNSTAQPGDVGIVSNESTGVWRVVSWQSASSTSPSFRNRLINGNFQINQIGVSGTVTLTAGQYGHDGWKGGASGCTYTFATVGGVVTLTIVSGTLVQIVNGKHLQSGIHTLGWNGTAQARYDTGSYGSSPQLGTATSGLNLSCEWGAGTLSLPQCEPGSSRTAFEHRDDEIQRCRKYYRTGRMYFLSNGLSGGGFGYRSDFDCPMNSTPVIAYSNTSYLNASELATAEVDALGLVVTATASTSSAARFITDYTASARL